MSPVIYVTRKLKLADVSFSQLRSFDACPYKFAQMYASKLLITHPLQNLNSESEVHPNADYYTERAISR